MRLPPSLFLCFAVMIVGINWAISGIMVAREYHVAVSGDVEVNHGPFLVDNNIFLSPTALLDMSQGGAFVHNIWAGRLTLRPEPRRDTPYFKPHSTEIAGLAFTQNGDNRFFNNIFVGPREDLDGQPSPDYGLAHYANTPIPNVVHGNVYWRGANAYPQEESAIREPDFDPGLRVSMEPDGIYLEFRYSSNLANAACRPVNGERLGISAIAQAPFEKADGSPAEVTTDYFGMIRDTEHPVPGPFAFRGVWPAKVRMWPRGR